MCWGATSQTTTKRPQLHRRRLSTRVEQSRALSLPGEQPFRAKNVIHFKRLSSRSCFIGPDFFRQYYVKLFVPVPRCVSNGRVDMAGEYSETTYVPEIKDAEGKERERQLVEEGTTMWKRQKEESLRQKHREQRELREILASYSPWGKPGGGAPCPATLRKKNVPLEPPEPVRSQTAGQGWTSDSTIRRLSRRRDIDPLAVTDMNKFFDGKADPGITSNLQPLRDTRNLCNEEVQVYELTGGVELVPLLTSRRHHSQPQTIRYHVTDVTRPGYTIESLRSFDVANRKYISELAEQIRRKQDRAYEEQRAEQESCRRHFDTWRKLWGRPGHGAPIDHVHRNNLYNILYRPAIY